MDSSGSEFRDVVQYGEDGVSGAYLVLRRFCNTLLACVGRGRACRKVPSMSKVRRGAGTQRRASVGGGQYM